MNPMRRGATLYELLIALCMMATLLSLALPRAGTALDGLRSRAARETAFALFSRARVTALQQGGASIMVDALGDRIVVATRENIEHEQLFPDVDVRLGGSADTVTLRYDAHGLGRMMSRTVSFQVRSKTAGLTISSFGRVRRW